MSRRWQRSEVIVVRDVRDGVVRAATPVTVVEHSERRLVYCVTEGTRFQMRSAGRRTPGYDPQTAAWEEHCWDGPGSLTIRDFAAAFAVKAFWRGDQREFTGWYINLESALSPSRFGFDRLDHVLDVLIAPDLRTHGGGRTRMNSP